jgi:diacylglycerol O-acyltransferase
MDRLSILDAEFLHLEDESSPMHIACLCVFEGAPPTREETHRLLSAKLTLLPRYRKRIRVPPAELGRPVWVDDPHFDLDYHVRRTALPAPGDEEALCTLMGRLMAQRLDRQRPLWELWIVEGLEGGRWALISKVHHAMVDGISGIDLVQTVLDTAPDSPLPPLTPWVPEREPTDAELVLDAWRGLAEDTRRLAARMWEGAAHPAENAKLLAGAAAGLMTFTSKLWGVDKPGLAGTIGSHRRYAIAAANLADVQEIRKQLGGTVNDVVLAAASGGYRALLLAQGEDPASVTMRSLVPVSVRAPSERGTLGNRVSALLLDLPVHIADPAARLEAVHDEMQRLKASHMAEAGALVMNLGDLAPPMVIGAISRAVARAMHQMPQRTIATVTTNVPGPREQLYFLGRKMAAWYPYVPIYQGVRVGTAILSNHGLLTFGVTADADSVRDARVLARGIECGIAELLALARARGLRAAAAERNGCGVPSLPN